MGSKDAGEKLKVFLESTPPNIKARIPGLAKEHLPPTSGGGSRWWVVVSSGPRRLELHCDVDDGVRRFEASDENSLDNSFQFLTYVCRDCGVYEKTYALKMVLQRVGGDGIAEVMKLGNTRLSAHLYPLESRSFSAMMTWSCIGKGRAQKRRDSGSARQHTFAASLIAIGSSL